MKETVTHALGGARVIPVLKIDDANHALPLAGALIAGGITVLEVTLRTPAAAEAARAMIGAYPEARIGIGTIIDSDGLALAWEMGAAFAVSPGLTPDLAEEAAGLDLPYLPGVSTVSEAMIARDAGFKQLKLFPADLVGGPRLLKAMASLFPDLTFCPTGGITAENMGDYLSQPNVFAIGGSWLAPADRVAAEDWPAITALAQAAVEGKI